MARFLDCGRPSRGYVVRGLFSGGAAEDGLILARSRGDARRRARADWAAVGRRPARLVIVATLDDLRRHGRGRPSAGRRWKSWRRYMERRQSGG